MNTLVIGDIHGCHDEFLKLLELAEISPRDRVVSVGDLVDRGPKSLEVVRYFMERPDRFCAVRGNHEQKHLRCRGQGINSLAGRVLRKKTAADDYEQMLDFFESLPYFLELDEATVVHAGLNPSLAMVDQDPKVLMGVGSIKRPGFDGRTPWWFDDPALESAKPIVFGHERFPAIPRGRFANVWGIDTGAAVGGQLTGLLLPEFRLLSVPTPDYWGMEQGYWRSRFHAEDLGRLPWSQVLALAEAPPHWHEGEISRLARMRTAYHSLLDGIAKTTEHIKSTHRYAQLNGGEKRELRLQLQQEAETASLLQRLALDCLNGKEPKLVLEKHFPHADALEASGLLS